MSSRPVGSLVISIIGDAGPLSATISEMEAKISEFSDNIAETAASIAESFAFAELGTKAFEAAERFEQASFTIQRATGATGDALAQLDETTKAIYANTAASLDTISNAVSQLSVRTNATGEALEALTTANLQLAKVTGTDVNQNIQTTQKLFEQWGVTTEEQAGHLDVLYTAFQKTGTSVSTIAAGMTAAGPILRALGYSFDESAALVAKFEASGVGTEKVLQSLSQALATLTQKGFKDPQDELRNLIQRMQDSGSAAAALQIALSDGLSKRGALALADAASRGAFSIGTLTTAMQNSTGAVSTTAAATQGIADKWANFTHQLNLALEPLGKPLVDALTTALTTAKPLVQEIGNLAEGFGKLPAPVQTAAIGLVAVSAAAPLAATGIKAVAGAFEALAASSAFTAIASLPQLFGNIKFALSNDLVGALTSTETALLAVGTAGLYAIGAFATYKSLEYTADDFTRLYKILGDGSSPWAPLSDQLNKAKQALGDFSTIISSGVVPQSTGFFGVLANAVQPTGLLGKAMDAVGIAINAVRAVLPDLSFSSITRSILENITIFGQFASVMDRVVAAAEYLTGKYSTMDAAVAGVAQKIQDATAKMQAQSAAAASVTTAVNNAANANHANQLSAEELAKIQQQLAQAYSTLGIETNNYRQTLAALAELWRVHGQAIGPVVGDYQVLFNEYQKGNLTLGGFVQALQSVGAQLVAHADSLKLPTVALAQLSGQAQLSAAQIDALNTNSQVTAAIFERIADPILNVNRDLLDMAQVSQDALQRFGTYLQPLNPQLLQLQSDMLTLGVQTQASLEGAANAAKQAYDRISQNAQASFLDVQRAFVAMVDAQVAAGDEVSQQTIAQYNNIKNSLKQDLADSTSDVKSFVQQVDTSLTKDLSTSISDVLFQTETLGQAFTKLGENIVKIILDQVIGQALKPLLGSLNSIFSSIGGFGKSSGSAGSQVGGITGTLATAIAANTAAVTINAATTTANTAATVADTTATGVNAAATSVNATATSVNAASQIAALVANTGASVTQTAVTSTISFPSEVANTDAIIANTAAVLSAAATTGASGAGGFFGGLLGLFGFARGGVVPSAAGGFVVDNSGGGAIPAFLHVREMVLPADLSEGLQQLIRSGRSASASIGGVLSGAANITATSGTINIQPGAIVIHGQRDPRAAADQVMRALPRLLKGYTSAFAAQ